MGKIIVIGSSNTDMVVTSSKMPLPGETVLGSEFDIIQGGKGANQAVAVARAGGNVTFIAKVGNDSFGTNAINGYKADNIDTNYVLIDDNKPTGVAVIIVDENSGQNSIVVAPGANGNLSVEDIEKVESEIKSADILLIQLEIPLKTVMFALKLAKENGIKTILNPAPAKLLSDDILKKIDIITPNETETEILTGIEITDDASMKKAAAILLESINDTVIITLGSKGAYYLNKTGEEGIVPAQKVNAVDTTAAGDVFNGYLAASLATKKPLHDSILLANKAAAISVLGKGAQPSIPSLQQVINYKQRQFD